MTQTVPARVQRKEKEDWGDGTVMGFRCCGLSCAGHLEGQKENWRIYVGNLVDPLRSSGRQSPVPH